MKRFRGVSGPLRKLWDGPDVQSRNKMLIKPVTTDRSLLCKKTFPTEIGSSTKRRANLSASQVFALLAVVILKEATEEWLARADDFRTCATPVKASSSCRVAWHGQSLKLRAQGEL